MPASFGSFGLLAACKVLVLDISLETEPFRLAVTGFDEAAAVTLNPLPCLVRVTDRFVLSFLPFSFSES